MFRSVWIYKTRNRPEVSEEPKNTLSKIKPETNYNAFTIGTYDLTSNAVANVNTEAWSYIYMISSLLVTEVIGKHSDHVSAINPQGHQNFCHLYLQLIYVLRNLLYLLHRTTNNRLLV